MEEIERDARDVQISQQRLHEERSKKLEKRLEKQESPRRRAQAARGGESEADERERRARVAVAERSCSTRGGEAETE